MVRVGFVTLVTILVGSVTSTCLRLSFGDMRNFSAPIVPVSSGAVPGQSSTTSGWSAPNTGPTKHNHVTRETAAAKRLMVAPLLRDEEQFLSRLAGGTPLPVGRGWRWWRAGLGIFRSLEELAFPCLIEPGLDLLTILLGNVEADPAPSQFLRHDERRAAAGKRVQHGFSRFGAGTDDSSQQLFR